MLMPSMLTLFHDIRLPFSPFSICRYVYAIAAMMLLIIDILLLSLFAMPCRQCFRHAIIFMPLSMPCFRHAYASYAMIRHYIITPERCCLRHNVICCLLVAMPLLLIDAATIAALRYFL